MTAGTPIRVAVIGCGAVVEQYHAPALEALEASGALEVIVLCDPAETRLESLAQRFPRAARSIAIDGVLDRRPDLALIASPPALHAAQAVALLAAGTDVLCEKPLAPASAEVSRMIDAARDSQRMLAAGLFRRFFSATRSVRDLIRSERLGAFRSAMVTEAGGFEWPFRTASAFTPSLTPGGVLLDIGVHAVDLLTWWFPEIGLVRYQDDAMGGSEATAVIELSVSDAPVSVTLSRDWPIRSRYELRFDRARIVWEGIDPAAVRVEWDGPQARGLLLNEKDPLTRTWNDAFIRQLQDVIAASRERRAPAVSGVDALASHRLIDDCYRRRTLLPSPWFSEAERAAAIAAAGERAAS